VQVVSEGETSSAIAARRLRNLSHRTQDLDNSGDRVIAAEAAGLYTYYRNRGAAVYFTVYDLLPVRMPQYFTPGADHNFEKWLGVLLKMDGAVCISQTVVEDFCNWALSNDASGQSPFHVGWFHLGADIDNTAPTRGSGNLSDFIARSAPSSRARKD
jgi:hypothetical protein